jgi:UDP-N-acetylmuramate--alanine ligase
VTRTAADIGAGLAGVRPARAIRPGERIHVVGVAGAGASAAALLAQGAGAVVSGCDPGGASPYTPALEAAGIPLAWTHDPAHVELVAARSLGIELDPWQQVVADAATGRRLVAVAGTHGKSTSAGWLTHVLASAGRDPSAFVGALLPAAITGGLPATARQGRGAVFVVEADEYAGNFDAYRPDLVALTNVDYDHPDVFADLDAVVEAFAGWLERAPDATLVANVADPGVGRLLARLRIGRRRLAAVEGPEVLEAGADGTVVRLRGSFLPQGRPERVRLRVPGRHNAANGALVAAAALELGLSWAEVAAGLETFQGVGRRLERKGEAGGVTVYDDYGHHPTAIRATIDAIRQREPGRRLWVAHEPLTFHRTAALHEDLAAALALADGVAVADIWAGRDPDLTIASSRQLADDVARIDPGLPVAAPGDVEAAADWLAEHVTGGDVVLVMGGGRSYRIAEGLLERLGARPPAGGS